MLKLLLILLLKKLDFKSIKTWSLMRVFVEQFKTDLQKDVGHVVNHHDQGSDASEVARPGKAQQGDGCDVVDEHFPKVLPFDIVELRECQRPIQR